MKVLVAHWRPDIVSGAELAIADVVANRSDDIEYAMLVPGPGVLATHYRACGWEVWVEKVQTPRRLFPGLHTLQSRMLAAKLGRRGIDIVVSNTFPAASRVGTACRIARKPHAIYVREYIRDTVLHRSILGRADHVLGVSADLVAYLRELGRCERVSVGYDPLDEASIARRVRVHREGQVRSVPFVGSHPVIGYVGRLTTYKQPDLFLRTVPEILKRVPEAGFVVVGSAVGKERAYEAELKKMATDLGIGPRVAFLGHRKDALEILSELDVLCVPSTREPFPRVVLEAQAVGCLVVASNRGGCPEMIRHGHTGLLFDVAAPDASRRLAEAVVSVLESPDWTRRMVEEGEREMRSNFGGKGPIARIEAQWRRMMETPGSGTGR